jgi:hypothetical protein
MDIVASFVADGEAPELPQSRQGAFDHPATATRLLAGRDALAGDADRDAPPVQVATAARDITGLVGMQRDRTGARPSALRLRWLQREQRFDPIPEVVRHTECAHADDRCTSDFPVIAEAQEPWLP